jgi:SAM-dependent methyltransferase
VTTVLRAEGGATIPLELHRWRGAVDEGDRWLLDGATDPVLDVGCGPGRIATALAQQGRVALGIDPSPAAAGEAIRNGAPFLRRSVFDALPGEGRWGTALLLDGNVGIGGDPVRLLRRCGELIRPGGLVMADVSAPGTTTSLLQVRVETARDRGPWFSWAVVGAEAWHARAAQAGLHPHPLRRHQDRWVGVASRA